MRCPRLHELPPSPAGKNGWPWTEETSPASDHDGRGGLPKVTIVTPSLNHAPYMEETIRSVLLQGYPDLEYIVIDGGSTDGSIDIIKKYEPWIAYWASESDRGQSHAINKGFARSSGRILGWLNSDDYFLPGGLVHMAELAVKHPDAPAWVGGCWDIDRHGNRLRLLLPRVGDKSAFADWWHDGYFNQQGCLFGRKAFERIGGLNEKLYFLLDVEYWMRLAELGPFATSDEAVAASRLHEEAKTFQDAAMREVEHIAVNFSMEEREIARRRLLRFAGERFGREKLTWTMPQLLHLLADRVYRDMRNLWRRLASRRSAGDRMVP